MKYVRAIVRIILVISVLVIVIVAIVQVPKRTCRRVEVIAHSQNESVIFGQHEVEKMLASSGIKVVGKKRNEIDLPTLTQKLKNNPYIKEINFVHFATDRLIIDYTLRHIILHVYTQNDTQYFVDTEGHLLPFTPKMQDYLFVANGNIHQPYKKGSLAEKELASIVSLTNLLNADEFYRNQFKQIYCNEHNQFELVATLGNQVILFGTTENAAEKLDNLKQVYKEGLSRKGFNQYAQLDVRYKNRVIAHHK